jgi:Flp pilus assembly protein TadG
MSFAVWRRAARRRHLFRTRRDDGYSIVEAAITLPALVLLCMIVVQYALLWHGRHVVEAAARDGVEAARGYQATAGAGHAAASQYLAAVAPRLITGPAISVSRGATTVTVTIRATVLRVIPMGRYSVAESATGPVERFVAAGSAAWNSPAFQGTGMWL